MLVIILLYLLFLSPFSYAMEDNNDNGSIKSSSVLPHFLKENPAVVHFLVSQFPLETTKSSLELPMEPHSFATHGNTCAVGYQDAIHLTHNGQTRKSLNGHRGAVSCVKFGNDENTFISAGHDGNICVWDTQTGIIKTVLENGDKKAITDLVFTDEKTAFASIKHSSVSIWTPETSKPTRTFHELNSIINCLAFNANDNCAVGFGNGSIAIWDTKKGTSELLQERHSASLTALTYQDDNIVSAASDSTLKVWNAQLKKPIVETKPFQNEYVKSFKMIESGPLALTNKGNIYFVNINDGSISQMAHRNLKNIFYIDLNTKNCLSALSNAGIITANFGMLSQMLNSVNNLSVFQKKILMVAAQERKNNNTITFDANDITFAQEWKKFTPDMQQILSTKFSPRDNSMLGYAQWARRKLSSYLGHTYLDWDGYN